MLPFVCVFLNFFLQSCVVQVGLLPPWLGLFLGNFKFLSNVLKYFWFPLQTIKVPYKHSDSGDCLVSSYDEFLFTCACMNLCICACIAVCTCVCWVGLKEGHFKREEEKGLDREKVVEKELYEVSQKTIE